jgi:hypothetical protein
MDFSQILIPFLVRLPLFILWLIGIGIAVFRWRVHPRVSMSVILGFIILSVTACVGLLMVALLPQLMTNFSENRTIINFIFLVQRIGPFFELMGWILVLFAIFSGRKVTASASSELPTQ